MLHHRTYMNRNQHAEWVVFVHGAGGSSSIWFGQIRDFQKHHHVLLLDLRGHGYSKDPIYDRLRRYSFDTIGDDVIQVLDHLRIGSAHFVGISLGTIIIREIAGRAPERVSCMILGGAVMKLNVRSRILLQLGMLFKSVIPYLILYRFFAWIIMPKKNHRKSRFIFIGEARKLYQKEFKRWFTLASSTRPLLKLFRSEDTGIPTLFVMGQEDHMFLPSIRKLAAQQQSARLQVIPGCGHVVNIEQPGTFNQICLTFLSDIMPVKRKPEVQG